MKNCKICNKQYKDEFPHYCSNCGTNLSNQIEKTDVILFLSNFFRVIGIIGIILFTYPLASCAIQPVSIDATTFGGSLSLGDWLLAAIPVVLVIMSFILIRYFKKLCLSNIKVKC